MGQQQSSVGTGLRGESECLDQRLRAQTQERQRFIAEGLPVRSLRNVARDVVSREEAAVREARDPSRIAGLTEACEPLSSGQDIRLQEHRLQLTFRLLCGELDRLRLRIGAEDVGGPLVGHRDDELDLGLTLPRSKEITQRLT